MVSNCNTTVIDRLKLITFSFIIRCLQEEQACSKQEMEALQKQVLQITQDFKCQLQSKDLQIDEERQRSRNQKEEFEKTADALTTLRVSMEESKDVNRCLQEQLKSAKAQEDRTLISLRKAVVKMKEAKEINEQMGKKLQLLEAGKASLQDSIKNMKDAHERALEECRKSSQTSQDEYINELEENLQTAADQIITKDMDIEALKKVKSFLAEQLEKNEKKIQDQERIISELKGQQNKEVRGKRPERYPWNYHHRRT